MQMGEAAVGIMRILGRIERESLTLNLQLQLLYIGIFVINPL